MTTNIDLERMAETEKIPLNYIIYKDELVKLPKNKELYIIINMSSTGHPGTHWVSLYANKHYIIYFDSFGVVPSQEVIDWADGRKLIYNDIQAEELDGVNCGQLSLWFLKTINKIIN
jgi:hypothetical protein